MAKSPSPKRRTAPTRERSRDREQEQPEAAEQAPAAEEVQTAVQEPPPAPAAKVQRPEPQERTQERAQERSQDRDEDRAEEPMHNAPQGGEDVGDIDAETNAKYEQVKGGKLYIRDLQKMEVNQLHEIARQENIQDYVGLKKQDLIFQILRSRIRQNGLMYGEGVLEILPDGFGFLRSPEYNYLPCPDDIYISPSQIRRFGLRNGHVVQGQIRPPKESERYFALLRVEAINGEDPDRITEVTNFEDLTPLHPNRRLILETDPKELNMR